VFCDARRIEQLARHGRYTAGMLVHANTTSVSVAPRTRRPSSEGAKKAGSATAEGAEKAGKATAKGASTVGKTVTGKDKEKEKDKDK